MAYYKICIDINCPKDFISVCPLNSNLTVPNPLIVTSNSESKSKTPEVSNENTCI